MTDDHQAQFSRRELLAIAAAATAADAAIPQAVRANSAQRPSNTFGPLRQIDAGDLSVAFVDAGPAHGVPVILLHGWPYDIHSFEAVTLILTAKGFRVIVPFLRGYGPTRFLSLGTPRNGEQAALAMDLQALMNALHIDRAVLGGFDWGARTVDIFSALFPERVRGLVSVSGYLVGSQAAGLQPLAPEAELQWWYQFYFATERGRVGYEKSRNAFNRLIWKLASPQWKFDDATFNRSAASFDNPDHVAIVIHNYRWRLGLATGEERFAAIEQRLAAGPAISVPTITMEGDANGAPHPPPPSYRSKFTGKYEHRNISGGIGHNLPQEAPAEFARAILDVG